MEERPSYFAQIPADVRYCEDLTASEKLLYGELTCLCNKYGYCWASNRYFADLYNVKIPTVSLWIKHLKECGFISVEIVNKEGSKEVDGRIIRIASSNLYEKIERPPFDLSKDPSPKKSKGNNTRDNNTRNNNNYQSEFEKVWSLYPRKMGKQDALKAFIKARKEGIDVETIESGIRSYTEHIKANNTEERFIKHGSTYFNQRCWYDEYETKQQTIPSKPTTAFAAQQKLKEYYEGRN